MSDAPPAMRIMGEDAGLDSPPASAALLEIEDQPFRHAISLGLHCYTSATFKRLGFKRYSMPFDWMNTTVKTILDSFDHDFDELLDQKYYRVLTKADGHVDVLHDFYDPPPFVGFPHFNPTEPDGYGYLRRSVERFRQLLASPAPKFFLQVFRLENWDDTTFQPQFQALCNRIAKATTHATVVGISTCPAPAGQPVGMHLMWEAGPNRLYRFLSASVLGGTEFADRSDNAKVEDLVRGIFKEAAPVTAE